MTDEEFRRIYIFLKNKYGIDMSQKKEIINGRLTNYLNSNGYSSYTEYMNALENDMTGRLENGLVDMLTTNHTYFMREFEHFDFLKNTVLPYYREKLDSTKDLHIWCGAASSGEEPYMIAMLLMDFFGLEHDKWDTKILATDISREVLELAVAGRYTAEQLEVVPDSWKRRYFKKSRDGEAFEASQELKNQVLFRVLNLMDPFPFRNKLHVVFLRNVMIYFDKETKNELVRKVYDSLEPGGYFFIGRTESIDRNEVPFTMVEPSIFRKEE